MSTAHDEFPVLLRLPDLNAASWAKAASEPVVSPPPVAPAPPAPVSAMSEPVKESPRTIQLPQPVAQRPRVAQQLAEAGARAGQAAQQWVTTLSKSSGFAEMPLVKQIAVGGFFIGGLALFCFFMFNRGNDVDLDDGVTASAPMDVPIVDKAANETLTVTPISPEKDASPVNTKIATAPTGHQGSMIDASPLQVDVAKVEPEPKPEYGAIYKPTGVGQDARGSEVQNLPALGPRREAVASPYPSTDPGRFMYRPMGGAPENRRDMARLEGTIAPPTRR